MQEQYYATLNEVLVRQSHNEQFYTGDIENGSKSLTKEVVDTIAADRASIWLYSKDKSSIVCEQLYIKSEDAFYSKMELFQSDFEGYFEALSINPIIIAHDAETHPATTCFTEVYLHPLGIKSMLDVPILYKGNIIGVICIESLTPRVWVQAEIDFAQILSSLFSFAYSIKEGNTLKSFNKIFKEELKRERKILTNRMTAINRSNAVIEFDINGLVLFANENFLEIMGYTQNEVLGKHHSMFVFDEEKISENYAMFWEKLRSGDYHSGEIVRKKKDGTSAYLQATYNPILNEDGTVYRIMKIAVDRSINVIQQKEIDKKNTYLEHAAKIIRHDMHSGINTYIPRGISSLERRLTEDQIKELKIEMPLKMIKEGLTHTQKVYKGVYEFTNLVKADSVLHKQNANLRDTLYLYLKATSYLSQVELSDLGEWEVNESLFCTAIDNLIRNGLKYNDSDDKHVWLSLENNILIVQDNGRGLTQEDFEALSKPYTRKKDQKESGSGLGLNICTAILKEHGFTIGCEKNNIGTKIKINLKP